MSNLAVHADARAVGREWNWNDPAHGEHFRCCTWCGSIHPEDLAAETSWHADWADRKYGWPHKFYVDVPNRDPSTLYVIGAVSGPDSESMPGYIPWTKLTRAQRKIVHRDGWSPGKKDRWVKAFMFGTKSMHHAKFYTIHLADPLLPLATKDKIERAGGLKFKFDPSGHVTWVGYDVDWADDSND